MAHNFGSPKMLVTIVLIAATIGLQNTAQAIHCVKLADDDLIKSLKNGSLIGLRPYECVNIDIAPYNRFSNAAQYFNLDHYQIQLTNGDSSVQLFPRNKAFIYSTSENGTFTAPNYYKYYELRLSSDAVIGNDEMSFLTTCSEAETMLFSDEGDVAPRLLNRIHSWDNLKNLRTLQFSANARYISQLKLRPFLQRLPALESLVITFPGLILVDIDDFLVSQNIPSSWTRHGTMATNVVQFHKRH